MDEYDDGVANSWPMRVFTFTMGAAILSFGIWCLVRGRAYTIGMSSGLSTYSGVAAEFVAWSDVCFAVLVFSALVPFKHKKAQTIVFSVLFLIFLVLMGIGMLY